MRNNKLWINHILKYGLILGLSLSLIEFFALYRGMLFSQHLSFIYIVFVELMLMIAVRRYRDFFQNGFISFLDAFWTGLFVCLLAGFIWSIYLYFQYLLVPEIIEEMISEATMGMSQSTKSSDQGELFNSLVERLVNPFTLSFIGTFILKMGVGGSILSLFLASLLKRKPLTNTPEK